jgi:hypothetical protein
MAALEKQFPRLKGLAELAEAGRFRTQDIVNIRNTKLTDLSKGERASCLALPNVCWPTCLHSAAHVSYESPSNMCLHVASCAHDSIWAICTCVPC